MDISFRLFFEEEEVNVVTYRHEYRSLMELISDRFYLEEFGECKGIGRCGTCMVRIIDKDKSFEEFERNEETTLLKMGIQNPLVRLSCQILIDDKLANCIISVL